MKKNNQSISNEKNINPVSLLLLVFTAMLFISLTRQYIDYLNSLKNTKEVSAIITSIVHTSNNDDIVNVEYIVKGIKYNNSIGYYTSKMAINDSITIYYDVDNPNKIVAKGTGTGYILSYILLSIMSLFVLFSINDEYYKLFKKMDIEMFIELVTILFGIMCAISLDFLIGFLLICGGLALILSNKKYFAKLSNKPKKSISFLPAIIISICFLIFGPIALFSGNLFAITIAIILILVGLYTLIKIIFIKKENIILEVIKIEQKAEIKYIYFKRVRKISNKLFFIIIFLGLDYTYIFATKTGIFNLHSQYKIDLKKYGVPTIESNDLQNTSTILLDEYKETDFEEC